jgi:hypothetical protein
MGGRLSRLALICSFSCFSACLSLSNKLNCAASFSSMAVRLSTSSFCESVAVCVWLLEGAASSRHSCRTIRVLVHRRHADYEHAHEVAYSITYRFIRHLLLNFLYGRLHRHTCVLLTGDWDHGGSNDAGPRSACGTSTRMVEDMPCCWRVTHTAQAVCAMLVWASCGHVLCDKHEECANIVIVTLYQCDVMHDTDTTRRHKPTHVYTQCCCHS